MADMKSLMRSADKEPLPCPRGRPQPAGGGTSRRRTALIAGVLALLCLLGPVLLWGAVKGRFFGEEIYDESKSTYKDLPRPPMYPDDVYSARHPNARPDTPPPRPSTPRKGFLAPKTLTRTADHVLVTGTLLPTAKGLKIDNFRLYSYRADVLEPIPFQIDERDERGWYVLGQGEHPSRGGTGLLKDDDELVFRARDSGDRVGPELWVQGYSQAYEIQIVDPLDNTTAWAYLFYFPSSAPPRSTEDYVDQVDHGPDGQAYVAKYYTLKYPHQSLMWYCAFGTREAGYDETNFVDHGYVNLEVTFLGLWKARITLENMIGTIPCYKDGPVRVIRRTKTRFRVGAMKLPIGLTYDLIFYDQYLNIPLNVETPINLKYVASQAWGSYGTDLNPNAIGMRWYSNYAPQGILLTGNANDDPAKKTMTKVLIPSKDDERYFHLVTGPHGTLMRRHIAAAGAVREKVKTYVTLVDDSTKEFSPEYFPGQIGNTLNELDLIDIPGGSYYALSEWYLCEHFKYPDDVQKYLNIVNHPPEVIVRQNGATEIGRASSSPLAPLFRFRH